MKSLLRYVSKAGRAFRYVGFAAFLVAIFLGRYNAAGIIGLITFFASFIFRTDETGVTPMERRSMFEKICGLEPENNETGDNEAEK